MRDSRGRRAVKLCEISAGYTVAWPIVHRTTTYGPEARDVPLLEPAVPRINSFHETSPCCDFTMQLVI